MFPFQRAYYTPTPKDKLEVIMLHATWSIRVTTLALMIIGSKAFAPNQLRCNRKTETEMKASRSDEVNNGALQRRLFLQTCGISTAMISCDAAFAKTDNLPTTLLQIKEARTQLEPVPNLIKEEKWDAVRAILIKPPLSDCWTKSSKLLNTYAQAIGDELPDGDELAALELKEEALDHIRFLDMAAYNNVFNPIRTEGEGGATKELIRSYYQDPVNEYKAVASALDGLIELSK